MRRQGDRMPQVKIQRIAELLRLEISMAVIADRMGCSRTHISKLNRRFGIRPPDARRK